MTKLAYHGNYPVDDIWGFKQARLLESRKLFVYGAIDAEDTPRTSADITDDFFQLLMDDATKPIHVYVMSNGGSAYGGLHLYDLFNNSPCPIYTYGQGIVASAAAIIFLAGTRRFISPHAWLMFHETSNVDFGKLSERKADQAHEVGMMKQFVEIMVSKSNMDFETITSKIDRNWWLNSENAVEAGFADQIGWKWE